MLLRVLLRTKQKVHVSPKAGARFIFASAKVINIKQFTK